MNYSQTAKLILENIGTEKNVTHFEHCSTRLRFTLADDSKVNIEALKKVKGVLGVVMTAQCQVVIGNSVVEVYDEILKIADFDTNKPKESPKDGKKKVKIGTAILDFIVGVFQPLVAVIAGAGILKSLLLLIVMFGWTTKDSTLYTVLYNIADAAFYFLPLIVAVSTANKLKCNRYVALAAVGALLLPSMTTLISSGFSIFGMPVQNISYATQVFPALLSVLFMAGVEKLFNKITPKPIRIFFVPLMCFVIAVPVTLVALGPLGFFIGEGFTTVLLFLFGKLGWVAVTLLAVALPFMIATGMHKALVPYAVSSIGTMGKELLYLPASLAHNISEGGACFGVAIRTKDSDTRATAISAGISALFGITEPALYGLTIQNKRALIPVMIGCVSGGAYIGITSVEAYAAVGPGIASISMYISETLPMNIVNAAIGALIAFAASFAAALIMWKNKSGQAENEDLQNNGKEARKISDGEIFSPADGKVISLSEVPDDVFSAGVLGDGVAIVPESGQIYAPANATINTVFDTNHAISMTTDFGAEVLIHFGIDTVNLGGDGFEVQVSEGEKVERGQLILKADINKIKKSGYNIATPIIVANSSDFEMEIKDGKTVKKGDSLLSLSAKEVQ